LAETTLKNTIVALNMSASGGGPDFYGTAISQGHNLIGDGSDLLGLTHDVLGDQVGTSVAPIDPMLGLLQDNGGPTFTHALLAGSPAIDAGDNDGAPFLDQRGAPRIQNSTIDIGAFESGPDDDFVSLEEAVDVALSDEQWLDDLIAPISLGA
jgi:hypothetical protein